MADNSLPKRPYILIRDFNCFLLSFTSGLGSFNPMVAMKVGLPHAHLVKLVKDMLDSMMVSILDKPMTWTI